MHYVSDSASDHKCNERCFQGFPLQTCGSACGLSPIIVAALARKDENLWKCILDWNKPDKVTMNCAHTIKHISANSSLLRAQIISWIVDRDEVSVCYVVPKLASSKKDNNSPTDRIFTSADNPVTKTLPTNTKISDNPVENLPVDTEMPEAVENLTADTETPAESLSANTETPAESLTVNIETPSESWPTYIEMPEENLSANTETPAENLSVGTDTLEESQPDNIETPAVSLPADTETPREILIADTGTKSLSVGTETPAESLSTNTETPTESLTTNPETPAESLLVGTDMPADNIAKIATPAESLSADIGPSVEKVPAKTKTSATKSPPANNENPSDSYSSISDTKLPFPDVSKKFYFREGRRWGRNETRNKERDTAPLKTNKDGLNMLRRGNTSGSIHGNIEHLQEELKGEKDKQKQAIKHGVIKVAVKLEESMVLSTREAALSYTSERNRFLNIQDSTSSYRASDTYKILSNYLNVAQIDIFGVAYLFETHGRDLNQISQGIFSLMS